MATFFPHTTPRRCDHANVTALTGVPAASPEELHTALGLLALFVPEGPSHRQTQADHLCCDGGSCGPVSPPSLKSCRRKG